MVGFLIMLAFGACIVLMGLYMLKTGDPRLLHSYHYVGASPEARVKLARVSGGSLIAVGVGCALIGTPLSTPLLDWGSVAGVALLIAGVAVMLVAIVHYNGGLIVFAQPSLGVFGDVPGWATMLVMALIGGILSLMGIMPGIHMIATGDVSALHSYHYVNVAAADMPAFSFAEGMCMVGLGVSVFLGMLAGGALLAYRTARWPKALMGLAVVLLTLCLMGLLVFIIIYNGSLMG